MLRNIFVLFPALALALPLIAAQPASANPLAAPAAETGFGEQTKPEKPGKPGGLETEEGFELALALCTTVQVLVENRECELVRNDDGTAVCDTRYKPGKKPGQPGKKPGQPGKKPGKKPGKEPTMPQDEGEAGGVIFISIEQCVALGVDLGVEN